MPVPAQPLALPLPEAVMTMLLLSARIDTAARADEGGHRGRYGDEVVLHRRATEGALARGLSKVGPRWPAIKGW